MAMTQYSNRLDLAWWRFIASGAPKLTVVADISGGLISAQRMGAGGNWAGKSGTVAFDRYVAALIT